MRNSYLGKRLRGGGYALKGALILIKTEHSIQVQIAITILITVAGFYFDISNTQWMFQMLSIGLVLSIEGLNTAIEGISDFVHPSFHSKIGYIKDVAAGAVLFAAFTAIVIAGLIYIPHIFPKFNY